MKTVSYSAAAFAACLFLLLTPAANATTALDAVGASETCDVEGLAHIFILSSYYCDTRGSCSPSSVHPAAAPCHEPQPTCINKSIIVLVGSTYDCAGKSYCPNDGTVVSVDSSYCGDYEILKVCQDGFCLPPGAPNDG